MNYDSKSIKNGMKRLLTKFVLMSLILTMVGPIERFIQGPSDPIEPEFEGGGVRASTIHADEMIQLDSKLLAHVEADQAPFEHRTTFLSAPLETDFEFDAVKMSWETYVPEGTEVELDVRFQEESGEWGPWFHVHEDIDYKEGDEPDTHSAQTLIPTRRAKSIQYRVEMESETGQVSPRIQNVTFHYIDASVGKKPSPNESSESESVKTPETLASEEVDSLQSLTFGDGKLDIITREEWGADPSWLYWDEQDEEEEGDETEEEEEDEDSEPTLRELYPEEFVVDETLYQHHESGEKLGWPVEFVPQELKDSGVNKIFIHHTAGEMSTDPEATMRSLYYYHAISRGWKDIGYNYVVINGEVYEGRYRGGDDDRDGVAGHVRGANTGSIGIAVVGNYTHDQMSLEDLEALVQIVTEKADQHDIDVEKMSSFRGKLNFNLLGHRDHGSTACPGENLYKMLPLIRKLVANQIEEQEEEWLDYEGDEPYAFANANSYPVIEIEPYGTTEIKLKLKNVGEEAWPKGTYLVANQNPSADWIVHLVKDPDNPTSISTLDEEVEPGETATFVVEAEAMGRGGFESYDITLIYGDEKTGHYLDLPIYVHEPELRYEIQDIELDEERVEVGETISGTFELKNTGNVTWTKDGNYPMSVIPGEDNDFASTRNEWARMIEKEVAPGEVATFSFTLRAPETLGYYREQATVSIEDSVGFEGETIEFNITVYTTETQASLVDRTEDVDFERGETKEIWIELENIGNLTWKRDEFSVGKVHHPSIEMTTPTLDERRVDPGETGRISFEITAPEEGGNYILYLRPRIKGQNIIQSHIPFKFTVDEGEDHSLDELDRSHSDIRVKLSYDTETHGNPVITANGDFSVYSGKEEMKSFDSQESVEVRYSGGVYQVLSEDQAWVLDRAPHFIPEKESTVMELESYDNPPAWNTSLNDNRYRGSLQVQEEDGQLIVVNELPFNDYLKGVAEATNGEPTEKKRVMAIIARTYALYYLTEDIKFPGKDYHASDDPDVFQKYLGYEYETRANTWVDAVEDTQNQVVTYNGELIKTPYFTNSDGRTRSAEEVWGWTHTPYLISVSDPHSEGMSLNGHGVGLSGHGATMAAEAGYKAKEIIQYYYTGVEIESIGDL